MQELRCQLCGVQWTRLTVKGATPKACHLCRFHPEACMECAGTVLVDIRARPQKVRCRRCKEQRAALRTDRDCARRPVTRELACKACGKSWSWQVKRGRVPDRCPRCRKQIAGQRGEARDPLPKELALLEADPEAFTLALRAAGTDAALGARGGATRSQVAHARRRAGVGAVGRTGPTTGNDLWRRAQASPDLVDQAVSSAATFAEAAEGLGVSVKTLRKFRTRHDLHSLPRGRPDAGRVEAVSSAQERCLAEMGVDELTRALVHAGSDRKLAAALGESESAVRTARKRLGVPSAHALKAAATGWSEVIASGAAFEAAFEACGYDAAMADRYGVSAATVAKWRDSFGLPAGTYEAPLSSADTVAEHVPHLVPLWDAEANDYPPDRVSRGSTYIATWLCRRHPGHRTKRAVGYVCRAGEVLCGTCPPEPDPGQTLADRYPAIASQWHPERNHGLTARHVGPFSTYSAWWLCDAGCEYMEPVADRIKRIGCAECGRSLVADDTPLSEVIDSLAVSWHPTKNGCAPSDVHVSSTAIAWWMCPEGHETEAVIRTKVAGHGCPGCTTAHTSQVEAAVAEGLQRTLDREVARSVSITDRGGQVWAVDMAVTGTNVLVEYDGPHYHGSAASRERDVRKTLRLTEAGHLVVRIRPRPLAAISPHDVTDVPQPNGPRDRVSLDAIVTAAFDRIAALLT